MKKEPKYVAETLKWCNERRKEQGKKALKKMPKGVKADASSCPCGKAGNVLVWSTEWSGPGPEGTGYQCLPEAVRKFVRAFDTGKLPQYIA